MRHDARDVGVDDEDAARLDAFEARLHRRALAAARVGDDLGAGVASRLRALVVRRHDTRAADRDAGGEDVAEHRLRERPAHPADAWSRVFPSAPANGITTVATRQAYARLEILRREDRSDTDVSRARRGTSCRTSTLLESWPPRGAAARRRGPRRGRRRGSAPDELDLLPDLRLVANYGVGYDRVDVAACRERGVAVTNTPGVLDAAVADLTLALILACRRHLVESDRFVREGGWQRGWARPELLGRDLAGLDARPRRHRADRPRGRAAAPRRSGCAIVFHRRSGGLPLDELLAHVRRRLAPRAAHARDARPDLARAARPPPGRRDARQHRARRDRRRGGARRGARLGPHLGRSRRLRRRAARAGAAARPPERRADAAHRERDGRDAGGDDARARRQRARLRPRRAACRTRSTA